ncbi:MAG: hypothetical protein M3R31_04650 [Pseudomonadota bacterium]|nr:hypothetical protein [Pseudomonadota bacterium]
MLNWSTPSMRNKTPAPSWPLVRRLVCGGGLMLCAGWAVAQGTATAPALEPWDKTKFDERSTTIDNPWIPMKPGTRYVYEGTTIEDGKRVPHRVEITFTDLTKVIDGVRTLISYDLDFSGGRLAEAELAMFAQDKEGNVWRVGEYPEEYENGKITKAPAWIQGYAGARAGIMMKAEPKLGTPSYAEGWGPAVGWTDRGQVHEMGKSTKVRAGTFKDLLVIKETAASEAANAAQYKWYARGTGNVKVTWSGSDKSKETLELSRVEKLSPKALAAVREKALKLEKSAYAQSKDVYALTPPAEPLK